MRLILKIAWKIVFNHLVGIFQVRDMRLNWADCCHTQKPISLTWCVCDVFEYDNRPPPKIYQLNITMKPSEPSTTLYSTFFFIPPSHIIHGNTWWWGLSKHLHRVTLTQLIAFLWTIRRSEHAARLHHDEKHRHYISMILSFSLVLVITDDLKCR